VYIPWKHYRGGCGRNRKFRWVNRGEIWSIVSRFEKKMAKKIPPPVAAAKESWCCRFQLSALATAESALIRLLQLQFAAINVKSRQKVANWFACQRSVKPAETDSSSNCHQQLATCNTNWPAATTHRKLSYIEKKQPKSLTNGFWIDLYL